MWPTRYQIKVCEVCGGMTSAECPLHPEAELATLEVQPTWEERHARLHCYPEGQEPCDSCGKIKAIHQREGLTSICPVDPAYLSALQEKVREHNVRGITLCQDMAGWLSGQDIRPEEVNQQLINEAYSAVRQ